MKYHVPVKLKLHSFLALFLLITSCGKSTRESAQESLVGQWDVITIIDNITSSFNGQLNQTSQTFQDMNGSFIFTSNRMEYEYQTASMQSLEQNYSLVITRENSGFTKVNVFTINGDQENFRVRFGDQTDDAHEDANELLLEQTITSDSLTIDRFIELKRK